MSFTSLWYFPFLAGVAVIYYVLPGRPRRCFLLAASWFMYGLFGLPHFLLMVSVTLITYLAGRLAGTGKKGRKAALAVCIILVAGILFYFKYFDMFLSGVEFLGGVFGGELTFSERHVVLPAGISFYTFQSLAYVIDVYRGQAPEKNFARYALFLSFFPQLVAGPIEQASWLIPQLETGKAEREDVSAGIRYLLSGCVRKFVIADYMAGFVDEVYADPSGQSGAVLLLATVLFAIQIYCDFSGYTHIAIGSGRFLGIRLTENFDRPYLARGCRDFWKRWHITLTRWLTEYVYIPLGGNRKGEGRKYFNILIVFLLSGLWHGADMTFVLWGAFFGIWRIAEEKTGVRTGRAATFALVCLSWVFFRSRSVSEAFLVLQRIFTWADGGMLPAGAAELAGAALRIGILALLPRIIPESFCPEKKESAGQTGRCTADPASKYYIATVLGFLTAVCLLAAFGSGGGSSFIYFQF